MAKKKVRKEEDEEQFGPPPFDERKFYFNELELAKATILAALWGILVAVISTAVFALTNDFTIGLAVGVVAAIAIKPLLDRLRVVTHEMGKGKWLGLFFSYFMCWLAFWILLVNPPVLDLSPPVLNDETPRIQEINNLTAPPPAAAGLRRPIQIALGVTENSGLASITAEAFLAANMTKATLSNHTQDGRIHRWNMDNAVAGEYRYHFRAEDKTGRAATLDGSTTIVRSEPPTVVNIGISDGSNITYDTPIWLHVKDNARISEVYYTLDADTERNILNPEEQYETYRSDGIRDNVYRISPSQPHRWNTGPHLISFFASDAAGNTVNATYSYSVH